VDKDVKKVEVPAASQRAANPSLLRDALRSEHAAAFKPTLWTPSAVAIKAEVDPNDAEQEAIRIEIVSRPMQSNTNHLAALLKELAIDSKPAPSSAMASASPGDDLLALMDS
jgi:hypothetical protein